MKVIHICTHYNNYKDNISPFIRSQCISLEKEGLNIEYYRIKFKGLFGFLRNILSIKEYTSKKDYDILHAHGHASLLLPFVKSNSKFISYMGNEIVGDYKFSGSTTLLSKFRAYFVRLSSFSADCVLVKSESMLKFFKNSSKKKFKILPNGVNIVKFKPMDKYQIRNKLKIREDEKIILFGSSRKRSVKNYYLAQSAFLKLPKNKYKFFYLENIPHVCMPYLLNALDILVLTSFFEGSPNIVKEALSCGLPVISVDVGDVKKQLHGAGNCQIVNPDSSIIAQAIIKNFKSMNKRKSISNKKISTESISAKLIDLYQEFSA